MGNLADLLRPRPLLTGPDPTPPVMAATVLDVAPLRVKVPEFDGGKNALAAFGPANGLAEGDEVRVMLDGAGQFVVIAADAAPAGGGAPTGPAGGVLSGTYPDPGFAVNMATQAELDAEAAARDAADVDLAGDIAAEAGARAAADTTEATTRAAADTTLNTAISDHLADTVDAHDASAISFVAAGGIIATNVQAALQELDTEKATTVALAAHEADTTSIHGITDTSTLYRAGGTDVAVADGGTGSSTAAAARTALDVPSNADIAAITANNWVTNARMADESVGWVETQKGASGLAAGAFGAIRTTDVNPAVGTTIIFDGEEFDPSGAYNPATGVFTAPIKGIYRFSAIVQSNAIIAVGKYWQIEIRVGGTSQARALVTSGGGQSVYLPISYSTQLNAGDTVDVVRYSDAADTTINGEAARGSRFSGELVGRIA